MEEGKSYYSLYYLYYLLIFDYIILSYPIISLSIMRREENIIWLS